MLDTITSRQHWAMMLCRLACSVVAVLGATLVAHADDSTDALRAAAQNPVANMISVPLQNNTNFNYGPYDGTQNVLNFQPVIPFEINDDWNLVTRWVTPIIWQPQLSPSNGAEFGLGNATPSFFLSPNSKSTKFVWGVGPILWLPTATDTTLGNNKWGAGPTAVALTMQGPWVAGVLASNVWAGTGSGKVNQLTVQPFVNYNLPDGWYLTSSPIMTANWLAEDGDKWTVPLGGGFGRLFKVGDQPFNASLQGFYNVARPSDVGAVQVRFQIQAMFPTK